MNLVAASESDYNRFCFCASVAFTAFSQYFGYDALNQKQTQYSQIWHDSTSETMPVVNRRRQGPGLTYNAAGQLLTQPGYPDLPLTNLNFTWTAQGLLGKRHNGLYYEQMVQDVYIYDGDGLMVREELTRPPGWSGSGTFIYLRSTVLAGLAVTRLRPNGQKDEGYVYRSGSLVATHWSWSGEPQSWDIQYEEPVTGSKRHSGQLRDWRLEAEEFTADGINVGLEPPPPAPDPNAQPLFGGVFGLDNPTCFGGNYGCQACTLDGIEVQCALLSRALEAGAARQCPDNNCGPVPIQGEDENGNPHYAWRVFTGSGFWVSDGTDSENIFFDEIEYRDPHDPFSWAISFQGKKKTKGKGSPEKSVKPAGPMYRQAQVGDIIIAASSPSFDNVSSEIVAAIVKFANEQKCSDAFKKYNLRIPYDIVLGTKFRIAPFSALHSNGAAETLGITPAQLDAGKAAYPLRQNNPYAEFRPAGQTFRNIVKGIEGFTLLFNPARIHEDENFGSLEEVILHEFIHAGGEPGNSSTNGSKPYADLNHIKEEYEYIMKACGAPNNRKPN